ncbi:Alkyl hydroperoxide reductase C [BD1-7 clade bacterium]|uniref:Alkyl hydroperoxide reductase C n=1 Tax=BD1-7 clade bacterium TaxID=2029982 RepID=A0A5S9QTQ6_9GAMM|nr:Alkyl hydroperoxide reductase C [BD1-7 clade bacterium]CAA0121690.1 Alkyl hydroperoxide reductase C [BD1-7 clade bacterium]
MNLRINSTAPNFQAKTTQGPIDFHQWIGDHWAILFSHPKDFTPVCTTELGYMAGLADEFAKRNCKVMGLSADSLESHREWEKDIAETQGHKVNYPIVADADLAVSKLYNMLPEEVGGSTDERTPANNATVRSVFVIGPDKRIKMMMTYPMTTGRNFHELLRVVDSMQLTSEYKVATPANWQQGEDVIIVPTVSDKEAHELFPNGYDTVKPYLRTVSQPGQTSSHKGGRIH